MDARPRNLLQAVILGLAVTGSLAAGAGPAPRLPAGLDRALEAYILAGEIPGAQVAIINRNGSVKMDLTRSGFRWLPATPVWIASVTKLFTAITLADLVREGRMKLDDPVRLVVPEAAALPKFGNREITLRDLATHTSALPARAAGGSLLSTLGWTSPRAWRIAFRRYVLREHPGPLGGVSWSDLIAVLALEPLPRRPGARWEYSNLGMGLLGEAIGRADGRGYDDAVFARVSAPLELAHTRVRVGHGESEPLLQTDLGPLAGAGGMHATLLDLIRFAQAALGDAPEPLKTAVAMTLRPAGKDETGRTLYLGWQPGPRGRLYHTGTNHAFVGIHRGRGVAVVMLLAAECHDNEALGLAILDAAAGGRPAYPKPRVAVTVPAWVLAGLAGTYRLDARDALVLTPDGPALAAQFVKDGKAGGRAQLWALDERHFFCKEWNCTVEFAVTGKNKRIRATAARVRMDGFEGVYRP